MTTKLCQGLITTYYDLLCPVPHNCVKTFTVGLTSEEAKITLLLQMQSEWRTAFKRCVPAIWTPQLCQCRYLLFYRIYTIVLENNFEINYFTQSTPGSIFLIHTI